MPPLHSNTPEPANEAERLAAFAQFEFLNREAAPALQEICALAKSLFKTSFAGVTLVGKDEVILVTAEPDHPRRAAPRAGSHSALAIMEHDVLVGEGPWHAQGRWPVPGFFVAAPLAYAPGVNIGAFYLGDKTPRDFGESDKDLLRRWAALVMNELRRLCSQRELRHRELMLSQASRVAKVGSWEWDPHTNRMTWSDQMYELFEWPKTAPPMGAEDFLAVIAPADRERFLQEITKVGAGSGMGAVVEVLRPNGESRWFKIVSETEMVDGAPHRAYGSMQDVTELHLSHAKVERLAFRDPLTDLPNRALFNKQFTEEIIRAGETGTKVGLLMLDLDHFKEINDTLGHDAGDALLRQVSEVLTQSYRSTDTIARLGGDEFAIILPGICGPEDIARPTEILLDLLRHPVEHGGQVFTISASIGSAIYPNDNQDASQLLKNADIALYQAKAKGRNRLVSFEPSMRVAVARRIEILQEVRQGIQKGEFVLYYQPVVDIEPEAVTGFEALMRWNHPTRGLLTPEHFMAGFEDPELAMQLGEVTFNGALKQMRAWIEQDVEFGRMALNVSATQFRDPDLAAHIEAKLKHWGVPADRLTIEVTENVYMGWGADVVGDTVRRLHDAGILIALDDFGTGYASLTNLKQFPIDRLKIDKSFVQNADDQAIVQAVINLGSSLGMKVVAEGVEETDQLAFLALNGCHQVQGYHFAKPMPGTAVPGFLKDFARAGGSLAQAS